MAARPEIVALMIDNDPDEGPFLHEDGRPFTFAERRLIQQAGNEEHDAANVERLRLIAEGRVLNAQREQEIAALRAERERWRRTEEAQMAHGGCLVGELPPDVLAELGFARVDMPADLAG
jgi:hypothetical protein